MKIEETTTGLIIHNPSPIVKQKCLQYFSLTNPLREFFIYTKDHSTGEEAIYITSGFARIKDERLRYELSSRKAIKPPMGDKIELDIKRKPRSELQRDCINHLVNNRGGKVTVELKPGTGKAEPYSRKIPTPNSPNGYKLMGDFVVGDEVFDMHGNPSQITAIFEQGVQDVYKITFVDGRIAYCTDEHLWTFRLKNKNEWITDKTKNIMKYYKRKKCYIPLCQPVNYPSRPVPIDPWVFGCFIGNGCLTSKDLQIYAPNDEVPNAIADKYGYTIKTISGTHAYIFYDKEGKNTIKTFDFFKDIPEMHRLQSYLKYIPDVYLYNNVDTRMHLLQGMMDINGMMEENNGEISITYTSTSELLLKQMSKLLFSLGFSGVVNTVSSDATSYYGTVSFNIPDKARHYVFSVMSKKLHALTADEEMKPCTYHNSLQIMDISYSHKEKCRCIMVNNPEHLYLTEDFIVTHNTFISLYSIAQLQAKPLIVTPSTMLKNQWIENLIDSGIKKEDIATNIFDGTTHKFTVITISSLENAMRDDLPKLLHVLSHANYGIKIIDEAHLHLKGMLKFDPLCNIAHNWYLSATLGRSDPQEDNILNRSLLDADRFVGSGIYEEYQHQYVNIFLQDIIYHPSDKLCGKHFKYGKKGLIRATYYNMLMDYQNGMAFIGNILTVIKRARQICSYGKILILVPLINIINAAVEFMRRDPYFQGHSIASVDGKLKISEKRQAMECEYILSTSMSMGVGVDVADLAVVINFDQYSSSIIGEQIFGRLRTRKDDKETYYIDICDHVKQARSIENWGRRRRVILPYFPGANPNVKMLPRISC